MMRFLVLAGWCIVGASGCGKSSLSVPVEGVVTLDGAPLANADVVIHPLKATGPGPFRGTTDSEGRFKLGSVDNDGGGAEPGMYRLSITTVKAVGDETTPQTQKEVVPQQYRDGTMQIEIPKEGTLAANFDLKSR
jgi:hypothetical protein